jgi:hypothetical protein
MYLGSLCCSVEIVKERPTFDANCKVFGQITRVIAKLGLSTETSGAPRPTVLARLALSYTSKLVKRGA